LGVMTSETSPLTLAVRQHGNLGQCLSHGAPTGSTKKRKKGNGSTNSPDGGGQPGESGSRDLEDVHSKAIGGRRRRLNSQIRENKRVITSDAGFLNHSSIRNHYLSWKAEILSAYSDGVKSDVRPRTPENWGKVMIGQKKHSLTTQLLGESKICRAPKTRHSGLISVIGKRNVFRSRLPKTSSHALASD